jgi:hypothetical protein
VSDRVRGAAVVKHTASRVFFERADFLSDVFGVGMFSIVEERLIEQRGQTGSDDENADLAWIKPLGSRRTARME